MWVSPEAVDEEGKPGGLPPCGSLHSGRSQYIPGEENIENLKMGGLR